MSHLIEVHAEGEVIYTMHKGMVVAWMVKGEQLVCIDAIEALNADEDAEDPSEVRQLFAVDVMPSQLKEELRAEEPKDNFNFDTFEVCATSRRDLYLKCPVCREQLDFDTFENEWPDIKLLRNVARAHWDVQAHA